MSQIRHNNRWGPLSVETVTSFERRNGFELSIDFRTFLLEHHGGVPAPDFYWVVAGDWGSGIESLYGFGPDGYQLQQYLDERDSLLISADLLPIGDDGCCSYLCLGIAGPRRGHVVYVDHEVAPGARERERTLSTSFAEFLASLTEAPAR